MAESANSLRPEEQVQKLQAAYDAYMVALSGTVALGESAIPVLTKALHKKANPIALALSYLMELPAAEKAIPGLLECVIPGSWPIFDDAQKALVRAGSKILPYLLARLREGVRQEDDEAVRHLLYVAAELPSDTHEKLVQVIVQLLHHANPHIREAAVDAIWKLGLPHGRPAESDLLDLAQNDPEEFVRAAADEALSRLGASAQLTNH